MIKTEYKKGGRPTKSVAEKKKYHITVKLNTQDYYTLKGKAKSAG
ncbi:MAG: plasmid mobilization relaxosome protein MobC, partial [Solobacterium sp.]|nr:plasmid mobilization relaxosome protein MobC [Solobacterium sp.]